MNIFSVADRIIRREAPGSAHPSLAPAPSIGASGRWVVCLAGMSVPGFGNGTRDSLKGNQFYRGHAMSHSLLRTSKLKVKVNRGSSLEDRLFP